MWYTVCLTTEAKDEKSDGCNVAVLINPKKKTFDGIKDFKGPVIVFATQKEDREAVEKSGRHDLTVVSSIDEALSKIKGTL